MGIKIDRLLAITIKLLSRRRWQTRELAAEFNVSTRTIYRDIQTLSIAGIPVISFQGLHGGWELDSGYILDRRLLNSKDIALLISGLQALQKDIKSQDIQNVLGKIQSLLTPDTQPLVESRLQHIFIDDQAWCSDRRGRGNLTRIREAIETCRLVRFQYLNLKNERSVRTVEPMTLMLKGHSWYLFAYCQIKADFRLFRTSRMLDITCLSDGFTRRHQTIETFYATPRPPLKRIVIRLRFHQSIWVKIGDWLGFEGITWDSDMGFITASVPDDNWLYTMLLGFGDQVVVESPKHVILRLKQDAKRIVALYTNNRK